MSISNETVRSLSTANGVTTAFAIPHTIISSDSSEVEVYLVNESVDPATETLQVEGALQDYTLTGASPPTTPFDTHVTFNTAPTNGLKVLIQRKIALTQPTDLDENGPFPAEEVETSLDRLAAEIQLLNFKLSRALKTRQSAPTANLNPSLPDPESGKLLRWNSGETGLENITPADVGIDTVFPGSSTDNAVARWDGTSGTSLQNSPLVVEDDGDVSGVKDLAATGGISAASTTISGNIRNTQLTASMAVVTDADKDLASSPVTAAELAYLSGVTSAIQTQLNNKIGPYVVQTKTSGYTALITDDVILCSGSSFTVALPAVATAYKPLLIKKTDSGTGVFTVDPNSSETVGGNATTALRTLGESVLLVPTSTGWEIANRVTNTNWASYTPTLSTWASNFTATGFWRRVGDSIQVQLLVSVTGATSGNLNSFTLPNSWTASSAKMIAPATGFYWPSLAFLRDTGSATHTGVAYPIAGSNIVGLQYLDASAQGSSINATAPFTWANGDTIAVFVEMPITDWEAA